MLKLNIGAGDTDLPGFTPIDAKLGHDALKLPYKDGEVDEVYASHVLEHIPRELASSALAEWVRVLKPGGRIRVAVPDLDKVLQLYTTGVLDINNVADWLYGNQDKFNQHQVQFNAASLTAMLRRCGIDNVEPWKPEYNDWSSSPASLNLGGTKRITIIPENPRVAMVLSAGRFVPGELMDCTVKVAAELGWKLYSFTAPGDWGKGLTEKVYEAINAEDLDYIMFIDHDSVFSADDCRGLLKLMQDHPEYGAIWPVQTHRHMDVPLGFDTNGNSAVNYATELSDMPSGHFGCTIMRKQVLQTLPEPWFMSMPNPDTGKWNMKNIDADLYLWAQMTFHGFKMAQANQIQIGHLEWCLKWTTPRGIIWQPIQHFRKNGKPTNAVFDGKYWSSGEWKEQAKITKIEPPPVAPPIAVESQDFLDKIESDRAEHEARLSEVGSLSGAP